MMGKVPKSATAFRIISEVATELDLPQHVLRFWETKFNAIRPMKRGGGRRYYRPEDVELLKKIRNLLYSDGYTIKGVQKLLRETGSKLTRHASRPTAVSLNPPAPPEADTQDEDPSLRAELKSIASELEDIRLKLLGADA